MAWRDGDNVLAFTRVSLPGGWLGNMSPHAVTHEGREWKTCEALFQALRFVHEDGRNRDIIGAIQRHNSPMGAKIIAKKNVQQMVVQRYSPLDLKNMWTVLKLKVDTHPDLRSQLLATGDQWLVEDVSSRMGGSGLFWGAARMEWGRWVGENMLGKLWMRVRSHLRETS